MLTPPEPAVAIQSDRDAAADIEEMYEGTTPKYDDLKEGRRDDHFAVKAFARHRLAHSARPDDQAEIERLRGLLIDPGSPPWEDARAVLVAELRKGGFPASASQIEAGQPGNVPSHIALNMIAHAAFARPDLGPNLNSYNEGHEDAQELAARPDVGEVVAPNLDGRCGFNGGNSLTALRSPKWMAACEKLASRYDYWKLDARAVQIRAGEPGWLIEQACVEALMDASSNDVGEVEGWRDIATAPKDGTEVDLWGGFEHEGSGRVPHSKWRTADANGPGWFTRGDRGWESLCAVNWKPTHWMPLPSPPALSTAVGEVGR